MAESLAPIDARRKRLRYRAWHRGMKEVDLLLGGFADAHLATMDEVELDQFELILGENDPDLYAWIVGGRPLPRDLESPIFRLLMKFKYRFDPAS